MPGNLKLQFRNWLPQASKTYIVYGCSALRSKSEGRNSHHWHSSDLIYSATLCHGFPYAQEGDHHPKWILGLWACSLCCCRVTPSWVVTGRACQRERDGFDSGDCRDEREGEAEKEKGNDINPSALKRPALGLNKAVSRTPIKLFLMDSHPRSISYLIIATIETINEVDITRTAECGNVECMYRLAEFLIRSQRSSGGRY